MKFKLIKEPELFQGRNKKNNYFEGWYFKNVSHDLKKKICIIPGVSINKNDEHSFIQTIINDSSSNEIMTHYHKFNINDFNYYDNPFKIKIKDNSFCCDYIELNLKNDEYSLKGKINYSELTKIKTNFIQPNTMGFFAYLPFMECYHEIISMNHYINGKLLYNKQEIDFSNGKGYIEKDWGTSFPKEYIWLQANNFENKNASIMCSIASIPFMLSEFKGFICNLTFDNKEYRFASYNLSKLKKVSYKNNFVNIVISKNNLILELCAELKDGGILKAPQKGLMQNTIKEGLSGVVDVRLKNTSGEILFLGKGSSCGIEVVNF